MFPLRSHFVNFIPRQMLKLLITLLSFYFYSSLATSTASHQTKDRTVRFAEDTKASAPPQTTKKNDGYIEKKASVKSQQNLDVDEVYACKCLPTDIMLPIIIQNPIEHIKELLKKISGSRQKFLFLYAVSIDVDEYKAFTFMKLCSKDDPDLSKLVREEAVDLIYYAEMKVEMKAVMEAVEKEKRVCPMFHSGYRLLKEKLNNWESPELSDKIFSLIKKRLESKGKVVKPNIYLPELLWRIIKEECEDPDASIALQLLATLMYTLDNPSATQDDLITMWIEARKDSKNEMVESIRERVEKALKQMPSIRKLVNFLVNEINLDADGVKKIIGSASHHLKTNYHKCFLKLLYDLLSNGR